MPQSFRLILFPLFMLAGLFALATDFPDRPFPYQHFYNLSQDLILSPGDSASLEDAFRQFSEESGVEFVGVIVDDLSGMEARYFANELANRWDIGGEQDDKALLLLCALNNRKSFLATGKGVQDLISDKAASALLVQYLVPQFRDENYAQGILNLIPAVQQKLNEPPTPNADRGILISVIIGLIFLLLQVLEYFKILPISKVDPRIAKGKYISLALIWAGMTAFLYLQTYFIFPASVGLGLLLAALVNSWVIRAVIVIWDKIRTFPKYTEEALNLDSAHSYLIYILFRSGKVSAARLAEKAFVELLFSGALSVAYDEAKYSPVKGKKVGTDSYLVSERERLKTLPLDFVLAKFKTRYYPLPIHELMRSALLLEDLFAIGERLVGSGIITYWSWKKGSWQLTEKGERLRQEAEQAREGIAQVLAHADGKLEDTLVELDKVKQILMAMPFFEKQVVPKLLEIARSSGPFKSKKPLPIDSKWTDEWDYWFRESMFLEANSFLGDLADAISETRALFNSSSRGSQTRSHSSNTDSYDDSPSYSEGSFDGGGGGADW